MAAINATSSFQIQHFLLICFPSIQTWQHWLSIPLALFFSLAIGANITLLMIITRDQNLHKPMYHFLGFLAILDLILCISTTPKILGILWFDLRTIDLPACFLQMFLMNCFLSMQSATFLFMAFDRYMAICNPLRYSSVINSRFVGKVLVFILIRNIVLCLPYPALAARLQYCSQSSVKHCVCTNVAVTSLSCDDARLNKIYQLVVGFGLLGSDFLLICLSYFMILREVVNLPGERAAAKAFGTCTPHLILISFFYTILLVWIFTTKMEELISPDAPILLNVLHLLVPPAMNPVVYSMKTKEIKHSIMKLMRRRNTHAKRVKQQLSG
ncbi:olfactory receptor 56A5-like [Pleurodeles waltl]|uniref:olfactory receptor 56A5-like n=1 Tax=Pleurodeles waltl TaxID=8319 RepID=UPI003709C2F0